MEIIFHSLKPDELKILIQEAVYEVIKEIPKPEQPEKQDQLIKLSEACNLLKVSAVTIHNWKRAGLIPFYRISNKIYFKKDEVLASLKSITRKSI